MMKKNDESWTLRKEARTRRRWKQRLGDHKVCPERCEDEKDVVRGGGVEEGHTVQIWFFFHACRAAPDFKAQVLVLVCDRGAAVD